ncbi:MAG TPA: hypothetical protein V6D23_25315, partial [Candidatus Obscuribacterales bacterium]
MKMGTGENKGVTWVLESEVFPESQASMQEAVRAAGCEEVLWRDDWLVSGKWPRLHDMPVIFHGSLGNADRIAREFPWRPGAFCDTEAFRCSAWYPRAQPFLLHRNWVLAPANALVADPERVLAPLGSPDAVFLRPDSPLKPFSGRVLRRDALSLRA